MADTSGMIVPVLREMRAEIATRFDAADRRFDAIDRRLDAMEATQKSFKRAPASDTPLSRLLTGEFERRIEAPEEKMERLEARR